VPSSAEPAVRVFYALVPPPALQRALGELAREVARRAHGRPVPAENIHLTLAFVGAWPSARLPLLTDIGAALAGMPMRVTLDVQGGFRGAGVAWIGPSRSPPALGALAGTLAGALTRAGIAQEERPFHPHLTLARKCRGPYMQAAVGPYEWDVDEVSLMRSDTRAEGARYERVAQWPLRSGATDPGRPG